MKLLSTNGGNTKIAKSMKSKLGTDLIRIASLSMMPDDVLCPARHIAGCAETCLRTSGRGVFQNVIDSRQAKTDWWHADREGFLVQLKREMHSFIRSCKRQGVKPVFRLNTISDIMWERYLDMEGEFGDAFFYDYTKLAARLLKTTPSNYKLMFSYSSKPEYASQVYLASKTDAPIAVVFKGNLPKMFLNRPVIDGDASDVQNVQAGPVVVGLLAKGKAKRDTGGFVVDATNLIGLG